MVEMENLEWTGHRGICASSDWSRETIRSRFVGTSSIPDVNEIAVRYPIPLGDHRKVRDDRAYFVSNFGQNWVGSFARSNSAWKTNFVAADTVTRGFANAKHAERNCISIWLTESRMDYRSSSFRRGDCLYSTPLFE